MRTTSDDLIHFVGPWTDDERDGIRQAVGAFETAWACSERSQSTSDAEWIVVHESPSWGEYYFAHRMDTHDSLTGRSAEELAAVIMDSTEEL